MVSQILGVFVKNSWFQRFPNQEKYSLWGKGLDVVTLKMPHNRQNWYLPAGHMHQGAGCSRCYYCLHLKVESRWKAGRTWNNSESERCFPNHPSESLTGWCLPFVEQTHGSLGLRIQGKRQQLQGHRQRGRVLHYEVLHLDTGKENQHPGRIQRRSGNTPAKSCMTWR